LPATLALNLTLALAAAFPSGQEPTVKETVVVTATVAPESLANVGRTVVLVTGEELRQLPLVSVADVLRLASSVDVRSRGARGIQSDFSIRGAGFGQALVLVNGMRINDAQSGHHNSDLPVPLEEIERVEILMGSGSSLHGADATGGTVNVITRAGGRRLAADASAGQHGLVETSATTGLVRAGIDHVFSGAFSRSGGFMPARDHNVGQARYQTTVHRNTTATLGLLDKEFGANGFYGPAPSREWTSQLLASIQHRYARGDRWYATADASYRTHGDRFIYDERNPSLSQSRHRTHALATNVQWHGTASPRTQISIAASGGHETIASSNLGDHAFSRGSLGAEIRQSLGSRIVLHPGIRVDTYSRFGTSWSPSVAVSGWTSRHVRLRASSGHAFRVPTFTELFYVDPNHQAAGALAPETAWSADAGVDTFGGSWTMGATFFARWEDNVIDWVRPSTAVRWRTANIRNVQTQGIETSLQRRLSVGGQVRLQYTLLTSEAQALGLLSKYVMDYARHSLAAAGSAEWRGVRLGSRAEWKRRADDRDYWTVDIQAARTIRRRAELYLQVMNLFDEHYQEIRGVDMPGRWVKIGARVK
jgi:iron complex outermembrane receptor protein